eukprot:gene3980-4609_t
MVPSPTGAKWNNVALPMTNNANGYGVTNTITFDGENVPLYIVYDTLPDPYTSGFEFGLISCLPFPPLDFKKAGPVTQNFGEYYATYTASFDYRQGLSCGADCYYCTIYSGFDGFTSWTIKLRPIANGRCTNTTIEVTIDRSISGDKTIVYLETPTVKVSPVLIKSTFVPAVSSTYPVSVKSQFLTGLLQITNPDNVPLYISDHSKQPTIIYLYPVLGNTDNGIHIFNDRLWDNSPKSYALYYMSSTEKPDIYKLKNTITPGTNPIIDLVDFLTEDKVSMVSVSTLLGPPGITYTATHSKNNINIDVPCRFPYGYGAGNALTYKPALNMLFSTYETGMTMTSTYLTWSSQGAYTQPTLYPPTVTYVNITSLGTFTKVFTVGFKDEGSGVYTIRFKSSNIDKTFTIADMVLGNSLLGAFQFVIDIAPAVSDDTFYGTIEYTIDVMDMAFNMATVRSQTFLSSLYVAQPMIQSTFRGIKDITTFRFDNLVVNVTNKAVKNILYFNVTNADRYMRPQIDLSRHMYDNPIDNSDIFAGYWDDSLGLYVIPFTIPMNTIEGNLKYRLLADPVFESIEISAAFPKSSIKVFSALTEIGWDFSIQDSPNGFKEGYIVIQSDYNPVPYTFNFTSANRTSGTIYNGAYSFRIPHVESSRSENFTFQLVLKDQANNIAMTNGPSNVYYPTPLHNVLQDPQAVTQMTIVSNTERARAESDPPNLCNFTVSSNTVDVGSLNRSIQISFTVCDDGSGVHLINTPTIYINSIYNENLGFRSTIDPASRKAVGIAPIVSYVCTLELPYGFGSTNTLYFSVHGLFDNVLNINGYSPMDLKAMGYQYSITRSQSRVPILVRHEPIRQSGGLLTVYGRAFGLEMFFSAIVFTINIPAFTKSSPDYYLTISLKNTPSNQLKISPIQDSVVLDPDFSVLVGQPTDSELTDLKCKGKSGLSKPQLIGIIVGSVIFGLAIVLSTVYFVHKRRQFKHQEKKMEAKLVRISQMN